jgi:hypothetical protein
MTPDWKQWEGRRIDGRFTLQRCLHSGPYNGLAGAVFLTEHGGGPAAIRLISGRPEVRRATSEALESGRATFASQPGEAARSGIVPVPMGLRSPSQSPITARKVLADVLKDRALDATETRQVLEPLLGNSGVPAFKWVRAWTSFAGQPDGRRRHDEALQRFDRTHRANLEAGRRRLRMFSD